MLSFTRARVPLGQIAVHRHAAQLDNMLLLLFVYSLAISPMQRGRPRKWPVSLWEQGKLAHATERFQCEARRAMRPEGLGCLVTCTTVVGMEGPPPVTHYFRCHGARSLG